MNQVDPMASKYASLTPYNYAFNDPVFFNDPLGDDASNPARGFNWSSYNRDGSWRDVGPQDAHAGGGSSMYGSSWNYETYGGGFAKYGVGMWSGPTYSQYANGGSIEYGMDKFGKMGIWVLSDHLRALSHEERLALYNFSGGATPGTHELIEGAKFMAFNALLEASDQDVPDPRDPIIGRPSGEQVYWSWDGKEDWAIYGFKDIETGKVNFYKLLVPKKDRSNVPLPATYMVVDGVLFDAQPVMRSTFNFLGTISFIPPNIMTGFRLGFADMNSDHYRGLTSPQSLPFRGLCGTCALDQRL